MNIDEILSKIRERVPGCNSVTLFGADGITLAGSSKDSYKFEIANAQLALIMKLIFKSIDLLKLNQVQDNLITTKESFLLTRSIKDASYFVCIVANRKKTNLGKMRLVSRQWSDAIWDAVSYTVKGIS